MVRGSTRARRNDKFYIINLLGLLPYCVIGVLATIYRVHDFDQNGKCLIGVERQTSILVIVYDLVINVCCSGERRMERLMVGLFDDTIFVAYSGVVFL